MAFHGQKLGAHRPYFKNSEHVFSSDPRTRTRKGRRSSAKQEIALPVERREKKGKQ